MGVYHNQLQKEKAQRKRRTNRKERRLARAAVVTGIDDVSVHRCCDAQQNRRKFRIG